MDRLLVHRHDGDRRRDPGLLTEQEVQEELVRLPVHQPRRDVQRRDAAWRHRELDLLIERRTFSLLIGCARLCPFSWSYHRGRAGEGEFGTIRKAGEQGAAIPDAYHLPEVVAVDELAVLIDRLRLEDERARLDEVPRIHSNTTFPA